MLPGTLLRAERTFNVSIDPRWYFDDLREIRYGDLAVYVGIQHRVRNGVIDGSLFVFVTRHGISLCQYNTIDERWMRHA